MSPASVRRILWVPVIQIRVIMIGDIAAALLSEHCADITSRRLAQSGFARARVLLGEVLGEVGAALMRLGGELVFVDESAEQVPAADPAEVDHVGQWLLVARRPLVERRPLPNKT